MEPTIRASIGLMAFTFEESAYRKLLDYIEKLRELLDAEESADETIRDIEYRLSELLQMRLEDNHKTINNDDVTAILQIMGTPEDLGLTNDQEESLDSQEGITSDKPNKEKGKKRLYRDKSNGIIGGVCSGLSHYFRIDVVLIRLIFTLPLLLWIFDFRLNSLIAGEILVYILLWIIVPNADSFEKKVVMTRAANQTNAIDNKNNRSYRGSGIRDILNIFYKTILIIAMIIAMFLCIGIVAAFIWFNLDNTLVYADNYISLLGLNSIQIKTSTLLLFIIPAIGLFALSYKLFRKTPFNTSSLVIFLLGLTVWLGAAAYAGGLALKYGPQTNSHAEEVENIKLNKNYDTIYITLADEYQQASQQPNASHILYRENEQSEWNDVCISERIRVIKDENIDHYKIDFIKESRAIDDATAYLKARESKSIYIVQDSLITLRPEWHNADNPWDFSTSKLTIRVPENKKVIIQGRLRGIWTKVKKENNEESLTNSDID